MKKAFVLALTLLFVSAGFGQKLEKIKGNRKVLTRVYTVPSFKRLSFGGDLRVKIKETPDTVKIQLRADENLQDVLGYSVHDGVLHLGVNKQIIRKKAFEITVFVNKSFEGLMLKDYARAEMDDKLNADAFYLQLADRARADLSLKVQDTMSVNLMNDSQLRGDLEAKKMYVHSTDNAKVNATFFVKKLKLQADRRAKFDLKGGIKNADLDLSGKANFYAYKTDFSHRVTIYGKKKSTAYLHAKNLEKLEINLTDSAALHVSGKVKKYDLNTFEDSAELYHEK